MRLRRELEKLVGPADANLVTTCMWMAPKRSVGSSWSSGWYQPPPKVCWQEL